MLRSPLCRVRIPLAILIVLAPLVVAGCAATPDAAPVTAAPAGVRYERVVHRIPMRDGVRLHTTVYRPIDDDDATPRARPMLIKRTPYGTGPYDGTGHPNRLGPTTLFDESGDYIFVHQDVRGRYLSEGDFVDMRPHRSVQAGAEIDESTDAYDTIAYLLDHVPRHNGRVGMWGISYPGFYAAAALTDAHPALIAVSPQAPIADWWYDDFHHHGAFFLPHCFNFMSSFGLPRPEPTTRHQRRPWAHGTPDGYAFFMALGALSNANPRYLKGDVAFWNELVAHPNYDAFWQARNLLPHLHDVAPAVMTVGGWFDAEDLYGPLNIYRAIEARNPSCDNVLVMGPWRHGGWVRTTGESLGGVSFGAETSAFYQRDLEKRFFDHWLRPGAAGRRPLPEATIFETGGNAWRTFDAWPPAGTVPATWYARGDGTLTPSPPTADDAPAHVFVSDPAHPVPYTEDIHIGMTREYMTDDQRFAARRPDVVVFQSDVLTEDVVLAGPVIAELVVSTSRDDADWVVKLIDVMPDDAPDDPALRAGRRTAGAQRMVRSEVIRGRFRDDPSTPKPFVPNEPTRVRLPLQDVLHRFRAGHRIMIQVQSTWFPLVDRNPQAWVDNIYHATDADFVSAEHRVYHTPEHATRLEVTVLPD